MRYLPCQARGVIGPVVGLVGLMSVWSATSISMWQHVQLYPQTCPWDAPACCWDTMQVSNQQFQPFPASTDWERWVDKSRLTSSFDWSGQGRWYDQWEQWEWGPVSLTSAVWPPEHWTLLHFQRSNPPRSLCLCLSVSLSLSLTHSSIPPPPPPRPSLSISHANKKYSHAVPPLFLCLPLPHPYVSLLPKKTSANGLNVKTAMLWA